MYINTSSKEMMELSVCEALNINKEELGDLLETCYNKFQKDHHVFIIDNQYDYFYDFVKKHLCMNIDYVMFTHLSRRLDDSKCSNCLKDVLLDKSLGLFLKSYGITFEYDEYLKLFIDNHEVDLNNDYYLNQRLYDDYSLKGFMFSDVLDIDSYQYGSEIINLLDKYADIVDDFIDKSIFYQFNYLVPLDKVYFDNYDELNDIDKQYHIIVKTLQRLYFYRYDQDFIYEDEEYIGIYEKYILKEDELLSKREL